MLSISEEGYIAVVNPIVPAAVKVPHRRQIRSALLGLRRATKQDNLAASEALNTICRFFGFTLDQLDDVLLK